MAPPSPFLVRRFMHLQQLLQQRKSAILKRWFDVILSTYPPQTQISLKKSTNRFANPVAHEISRGIEGIFDQLLSGERVEEASPFLDKVIRIRAVQELSPSEALAFMFELKRLVREEVSDSLTDTTFPEDLWSFERQIDALGLLSLDVYMKCREKIFELRVNEVKNRVGRLLERANMICGIPEKEGDPEMCSTDTLT